MDFIPHDDFVNCFKNRTTKTSRTIMIMKTIANESRILMA